MSSHRARPVDGLAVDGRAGNELEVADDAVFHDATIRFDGIGNQVSIGARVRLAGAISVSGAGSVRIGQDSTFGRVQLVAHGNELSIGADAMFAHDVEVRTTDRHCVYDVASGEHVNPDAAVRIGPHVWVGKRSTILKGVAVGRGAILALGSVVSRDVAEFCAVAGNPATVVRRGVTWTRFEGTGRLRDDLGAAAVVEHDR